MSAPTVVHITLEMCASGFMIQHMPQRSLSVFRPDRGVQSLQLKTCKNVFELTRPHAHTTTTHTHTTTHNHSHSHSHSQQHNDTHAETQTARWNTTHAKTYGDVLMVMSCESEEKTASKCKNRRSLLFFRVLEDRGSLWFDRVSKNIRHLLFCHGHWLLEGGQATTKPHTTRHKPHPTHHTPQAKPSQTEPTEPHQYEPSQAKRSHTTPRHVTRCPRCAIPVQTSLLRSTRRKCLLFDTSSRGKHMACECLCKSRSRRAWTAEMDDFEFHVSLSQWRLEPRDLR